MCFASPARRDRVMNIGNRAQGPGGPLGEGMHAAGAVRRVELDEIQQLRLRLVTAYGRIEQLHRELAGHYAAVGSDLQQALVSDLTLAAGVDAGRSATIQIDAGGRHATIHASNESAASEGSQPT